MDKPKISISINGIKRSFYEVNEEKLNQLVSIEEDNKEIEIKKSTNEIAASNEEREFEWILPKPNQNKQYDKTDSIKTLDDFRNNKNPLIEPIFVPNKQKKKNYKTSLIKSFLLAIISAIVIGTSFGLMILQLFAGSQQPMKNGIHHIEKVAIPNESDLLEEPLENDEGPAGIVTVSPLNVYLVQGGLFSTEAAITPILNQIKSKGLSGTIVNQDGMYYLFLGIGSTAEAAKIFLTPYEEINNIEGAFVKNLLTSERSGTKSVLQAKQMFEKLVTYTTELHLSTQKSNSWTEIQQMNKAINSPVSQSTEDLFVKSVINAYASVDKYRGSLSNQDFWETQQALLNSYQIYQKWILE